MFAALAFVSFLLALFGVHLGSIDLMKLGWCFIALHLLFGIGLPWLRRDPNP